MSGQFGVDRWKVCVPRWFSCIQQRWWNYKKRTSQRYAQNSKRTWFYAKDGHVRFMVFILWNNHLLQSWNWKYMVGIKSNRVLIHYPSPHQKETIPLKSFLIDQDGLRCRLKGLGIHRCFSQPSNKLGRKYWCTNHSNMKSQQWKETQTHFRPHRTLS